MPAFESLFFDEAVGAFESSNVNTATPVGFVDATFAAYGLVAGLFIVYWLALVLQTEILVRKAKSITKTHVGADVRSVKNLASPFAWRSIIVVPDEFVDWSAQKKQMILAHEQAHLTRGDVFVSVSTALYASLLWLHPLVWLLRRDILVNAERACDDLVLKQGHSPLEYSEELIKLQKRSRPQVAPAMASKPDLHVRIRAMLDPDIRRTSMHIRLFFGCCAIALAAMVPLASVGEAALDADIRPEHLEVLEMTQALIDAKDYATAKSQMAAFLTQTLTANERAQAYNLLGYVHFLEENYDAAIEAYNEVVVAPDAIPEGMLLVTHFTLAQLHFVNEDFERAIAAIDVWSGLAANPGHLPIIFKAQTLYRLGRYEQSLIEIRKGLSLARERDEEIKPNWIQLRDYLEYELGQKSTAESETS